MYTAKMTIKFFEDVGQKQSVMLSRQTWNKHHGKCHVQLKVKKYAKESDMIFVTIFLLFW